jgi:ribosomal protein S9
MIEANRTLIQRLDEQQTYIEERLNKRDELLVESLRETLETKKLLIATAKEQEREKELQKNTRRGIFNWFRKA